MQNSAYLRLVRNSNPRFENIDQGVFTAVGKMAVYHGKFVVCDGSQMLMGIHRISRVRGDRFDFYLRMVYSHFDGMTGGETNEPDR